MTAPAPKKSKRKEVNPLPWVILVVASICAAVWLLASKSENTMQTVEADDTVDIVLPKLPPPPPPPPPPPKNEPPPQDKEEEMLEQPPVDAEEEPPENAPDEPPSDIDLGPGTPGGSGPSIGGGGGGNGNRIGSRSGSGSKFGWYAARVQTSIREALSRNSATRSATLSIQVRIWVDQNGRVTRAQLVGSSGNPALDAAIKNQVLSGLLLPQAPPADLPMPINLRITARKATNG